MSGRFIAYYKRFVFSRLSFFSTIMQCAVCTVITSIFLCCPVGIQAWGTGTRNADTLTAITVNNKCSFVSDPGILCLMPTSLKLLSELVPLQVE